MYQPLNSNDLLWCVRRLPSAVVALLKAHPGRVFLAGGYIRSSVTGEKVNDIDLFVGSKADATLMAAELAADRSARVIRTDNAITIRRPDTPAIQFIHRWTYATPADCIAEFDFTIASAAFWWTGTAWASTCHRDFYADLAAKRLVYLAPQRNEDAGGSFLRMLKFYQRGYRIPLDSAGAIVARLVRGVDFSKPMVADEAGLAKVLTGLLREVDPHIDPDHIAHLPSTNGTDDTTVQEILS